MTSTSPAEAGGIDMSLYSRQYYTYGESAMKRMAGASVLIVGMTGLGIEVAKNVVLSGVKKVTVMDAGVCTRVDMGNQYYITEADLGQNRAVVSAQKLAELNPYVQVEARTEDLQTLPLDTLGSYSAVVLADAPWSLAYQTDVDKYCREHNIVFITAEVRGVACWAFADFGDKFEVSDRTGEEPITIAIDTITQGNPGEVRLQFNHHFNEGDPITFKDMAGMSALNGATHTITKVTGPTSFTIGDTSALPAFGGYGEVVEVKTASYVHHKPLSVEWTQPSGLQPIDFAKMEAPATLHVAFQALHRFRDEKGHWPRVWNEEDAAAVATIAASINQSGEPLDATIVRDLSYTAEGSLAPLVGFLGGLVAQEAIKATSGKFVPLSQWLYLDAREVIPESRVPASFQPLGDRYDALRACVGEETVQKLHDTRLFMVGAGAIGCEMLKYYAMMGVGTNGSIIITDPDVIEKSNLNRQFLFRPKDLQRLKSQAAAEAVQLMNPDVKADAYAHKLGPDTERIFTDKFFENQDLCVNALDNVEARLYMDNRCVLVQRPLLESGTLGTKGHVQTIVPFLTESYASRRDPPSKDFAVCTVKSFPTAIEHTIQWAKMKFNIEFSDKPTEVTKYFSQEGFIADMLKTNGPVIKTLKHVISAMSTFKVQTFEDCVRFARHRFEKLFNHDPRNLMLVYPVDHRNADGTLFWALPKRPPHPIDFDVSDPLHVSFVEAGANLLASVWGLPTQSRDAVIAILRSGSVTGPEYVPKKKKVQTEETPQVEAVDRKEYDRLAEIAGSLSKETGTLKLNALEFEKDDDTNFHIQFIMAASNLRARAYDIGEADFNKTKLIAGRIIPAIATTTASISGLVALELLKIRQGLKNISAYRNTGLNLADPFVSMYEPSEAQTIQMRPDLKMSFWDRFDVSLGDPTVEEVIQWFKKEHNLKVSAILQEQVMLYSWLDESARELPLTKHLRAPPRATYVYLDVVFSGVKVPPKHIPPKMRFYLPSAASRRTAAAAKRVKAAPAADEPSTS